MNITAVASVSLAAILSLSACSTARTPAPLTSADADLAGAVNRQLSSDPRIPVNEIGIIADASAHEVTLNGVLTTEADRSRAVNLARKAEPDLVIIDSINVVPMAASKEDYTSEMEREGRESAERLGMIVGDPSDDAFIYASIIAKLTADEDTSVREIRVDVMNQTVTLRGEVESGHVRGEAERIASGTPGVQEVRNLLTVELG
jgi:osmotically-inducible protein OsmY